jgi:hypothetical protein
MTAVCLVSHVDDMMSPTAHVANFAAKPAGNHQSFDNLASDTQVGARLA